jgi:chemotaxis response regulator CheB
MAVSPRSWSHPRATRVVIVARDEQFRHEARAVLGALPGASLAGEAVDGPSAAVICTLGCPDVVVIDAQLPWSEASNVVRRIRDAGLATCIVTCTASSPAGLAAAPLTIGLAMADFPREHLPSALRRCGSAPCGEPSGA